LLACYGPRFTVSIQTLVETGKGEQKEGFDILVHDGESGESKSVGLMSGGERVWISCRARHEIHYAANRVMPSSLRRRGFRASGRGPTSCRDGRHKTRVSAPDLSATHHAHSITLAEP
jgi:exonuclease SbcC